LPIVTCFS